MANFRDFLSEGAKNQTIKIPKTVGVTNDDVLASIEGTKVVGELKDGAVYVTGAIKELRSFLKKKQGWYDSEIAEFFPFLIEFKDNTSGVKAVKELRKMGQTPEGMITSDVDTPNDFKKEVTKWISKFEKQAKQGKDVSKELELYGDILVDYKNIYKMFRNEGWAY